MKNRLLVLKGHIGVLSKEVSTKEQVIILAILSIAFKILLDISYAMRLEGRSYYFALDINIGKVIIGWIICVILFSIIGFSKNRVSTFLNFMLFILQVIPITCVYSLTNQNTTYYLLTSLMIFIVELLVLKVDIPKYSIKSKLLVKMRPFLSKGMVFSFYIGLFVLLLFLYVKNGAPSLIALNMSRVYELRAMGDLQISKALNLLLNWMIKIIIPFLLAKSMLDKRYYVSFLLVLSVLVLYLYTGAKTYFFMIPLVVICTCIGSHKDYLFYIFSILLLGSILVMLVVLLLPPNFLFVNIYDYFIRRVMIVPAIVKFTWFEFFRYNDFAGIVNAFPDGMVNGINPYEGKVIGKVISEWAYGLPNMNANTGFLAEGFMMCGYIGLILVDLLYGIMVKIADVFESKVGHQLAVGTLVYPFFILNDAFLFDELVLGYWTVVIFIIFVYVNDKKSYDGN